MARRAPRREAIRNPSLLEQLSPRARQSRSRAMRSLSGMRQGLTLSEAAHKAHTTPANVRRWTDARVLRREGRRWRASSYDTLARFEPVVDTRTGEIRQVAVRSSKDASRLAEYYNSVDAWRRGATPEEAGLTGFEGQSIELADGGQMELVTDRMVLVDLDAQGTFDALEFETG